MQQQHPPSLPLPLLQLILPNLGGASVADRAASVGVDASSGKTSWPELLGADSEVAKATVQSEAPGKTVLLVPAGNLVTMDFRMDRVRIFYDRGTNRVAEVPRVG